jgi:hypothetical protein
MIRASTHNERGFLVCIFIYDPEPGVPKDVTPMAQCAFEFLVLRISAVHTNYRSWLRSSSIYEPSDPPIRVIALVFNQKCKNWGVCVGGTQSGAH